jgi:hypothetical protein
MNAQAWSTMYSPGMPPHPTPQISGGWYFDFPTAPNLVHYVLAAVSLAASVSVDASILLTTTDTETPMFVYNLQTDNTCLYPAHVRFLLQEKGDELSGTNGKQYFRWRSNKVAYQLAPGPAFEDGQVSLLIFEERLGRTLGSFRKNNDAITFIIVASFCQTTTQEIFVCTYPPCVWNSHPTHCSWFGLSGAATA